MQNDRILSDCIRAALAKRDIICAIPYSTRPNQHVLEALNAYLMIAAMQYDDIKFRVIIMWGPMNVIAFKRVVWLICSAINGAMEYVGQPV